MPETYNWENGLFLNPPAFPKKSAEYQPLLDSGDLSRLEDLLMEYIDTVPQDIACFLPAYRAFIRKQDYGRACALLGLHVESLKARHDLASELFLLHEMLGLWKGCQYARDLLLGHLRTMYADSPNFKHYAQHFQVMDEAAGLDTFRQLELWLRYDEGRVVYMPSKGVARIREANPKLGVVRMVLKNGEQISFRIEEAERLAQSLANSHFLARTVIDIDVLSQTAFNDPGELLRQFFASVRREVTLSELREMLSGIVPDDQWSAWWARARKDSRLIVGSGTKPKLNWNDSVSEGSAGLMAAFSAASIRDKLDMLKKHAMRSETLALEMAQALAKEASVTLQSDPSLALEIALTIADLSPCSGMAMFFTADELLSRTDAEAIIAGIKDRVVRRKAVQIVARTRDDWPIIFSSLLKVESDAPLFKLMYESLRDTGRNDVLVPEVEHVFSDPSGNPRFYVWLCKEMSNRPELHRHANWGFLRSLLGVIENKAFKAHHSALRKLFDPGGAVDRAMETLDAATGRSLLDVLSRVRELEDYRKESVRLKLFSLFPELNENRPTFLFVTKESLDKKRREYEKLVRDDIPRNSREIQRTREYGDLRENFEYHEARRQQELLSSRAKTLHDELVAARAIEPGTVDMSKISIGTRIRLQPDAGAGEPVTLTILGPWDSDPARNILSYTSAAAEALLNTAKGSTVMFNGVRWVVDAIDIWES
ncbi:MAG: GreA/GreB family elongation factor [Chitinispirillaceae bacterium]|nr:GreA/GreB family elongation factor [Chitinispirillaceae bacterium]